MTVPFPPADRVYVIAEAGVNHDGDPAVALEMGDAARAAGADAVKFQTWKPGELTGRFAFKVAYLEDTTDSAESRFELSNRLALPYDAFRRIERHARGAGIQFLSTPDGFESLAFLAGELGMPIIKVGSTEVTHVQFLEAVGRWNRPVILSTGLSTLGEVEEAVARVRRGGSSAPIVVLQCTSEYPAPLDELNVRALVTIREALGVPTGLSDHSTGFEAAIAAVALGARVIEKHFTLDKRRAGPDHKASLDPRELAELIAAIRRTERVLGDGIKRPTASELRNRDGIRRSVVATRPLPAGTRLERDMLTCKRPGTGIPPGSLDAVLGRTLARALAEDEPLGWRDLA